MTIYIKSRRNEVNIESAYADSRNYLKIEFLFPFLFLFLTNMVICLPTVPGRQ